MLLLSGKEALDFAQGDPDRLAESLRTMLTNLQDFIAEATALPWPGVTAMPSPVVDVTNGRIYVKFRTGDEPVLVLPPIDLR